MTDDRRTENGRHVRMLLMRVVLAALKTATHRRADAVGIDTSSGRLSPLDERDGALVGDVEHFNSEQVALVEQIDAMLDDSAQLETIMNAIPQTLDAAQLHAASALEDYRVALEDHATAHRAWATLDVQTGRTRQQCVKDLMTLRPDPEHEGETIKPLAYTAANAQASDHPAYTKHKDETHAAAMALVEAQAQLSYSEAIVKLSREMLRAQIAALTFPAPIGAAAS